MNKPNPRRKWATVDGRGWNGEKPGDKSLGLYAVAQSWKGQTRIADEEDTGCLQSVTPVGSTFGIQGALGIPETPQDATRGFVFAFSSVSADLQSALPRDHVPIMRFEFLKGLEGLWQNGLFH